MASSMKTNSNKTQVKFTQSGFPFKSNVTFLVTLSCGFASIFPKCVDQENEKRRLFNRLQHLFSPCNFIILEICRDYSGTNLSQEFSNYTDWLLKVIQGSPTEQCWGFHFCIYFVHLLSGDGSKHFHQQNNSNFRVILSVA